MDETVSEPPPRRGCNWLGCLVVLIIIAVLAGMLLPVINTTGHGHVYQSTCGKNQSQLLGALVAYETEFDVTYPGPLDPTIGPVTEAHQARLVTHQMLWILARHAGLHPSLLVCPKSARAKPAKPDGVRPPLTWGFEPGVAIYAFDWAAQADPPSSRVVMADRDQSGHGDKVMAVFGDAHVQAQKVKRITRATSVLITEGLDGKPVTMGTATPIYDREDDKPGPPDDIYSDDQDGAPEYNVLQQKDASNWRAWVK